MSHRSNWKMRHNQEFDMILRGMVQARADAGATIHELRSDYYQMNSEPWPLKNYDTDGIIKYILEIDGLMMQKLDSGLCIWYIDDIGNNMSASDADSNNNINYTSTTLETVSESDPQTSNSSYAIPPPRILSKERDSDASTSSDTLYIESIGNVSRKRNLSADSETAVHPAKRVTPLLENNLDIHNRHNGTDAVARKTTSTEIEHSMSVQSDLNGCIATNEYIEPIQELSSEQLQHNFTNGCQIQEKTSFMLSSSEASTKLVATGEHIFPHGFGVVGDDFMRSLINFELYSSDLIGESDKRFGYCISGQTCRDAYHLILDKQSQFKAQYTYIIVTVGAIDILMERDIIDIEADYARLVKAIHTIGLQPIITTVPRIRLNSNNPNAKTIIQSHLLFNHFLRDTFGHGFHTIDLYSTLFKPDCTDAIEDYHTYPKQVSVGTKKLELYCWTENGRKKILNAINSYISINSTKKP